MLEGDQAALEEALSDRYRFVRELGRGGWGVVWLADDLRQPRQVAIKILHLDLESAKPRERFLREIDIASHLNHDNIVPVYESGNHDGALYYVMPFVDGETLQQRMRRERQLPVNEALRIAREIAVALAHAHDHGVIHRDIKPANVLLSGEHVRVADFGIARAFSASAPPGWMSSASQLIGTPEYMSVEQASGEKNIDGRTDLYALGCVLYEMLAGAPPFTAGTPAAVMARHAFDQVPSLRTVRPTAAPAVESLVLLALGKTPADRFANASDMAAAITRALTDTSSATPVTTPAVAKSPRLGRPVQITIALGLALLAVTATMWWRNRVGLNAASSARNRVVVGVFENRTGDARFNQLGVMAADWVTDGLQRTRVLDVVPTATSLAAAHFLGSHTDLDPVRALADETSAQFVITGSIYRDGDSLVIRAQLSDVVRNSVASAMEPIRTGLDNPVEGLVQLRGRLMGLLALRLDERVGPADAQSESPPTFAAYQAFSEGLDAYVRNNYEPALTSFALANRLDSTFALPLLYLSICHTNQGEFSAADSVLRLVARHRQQLSLLDRNWLDYEQAELEGRHADALTAIRRAATLSPGSKAVYNFAVQAFQARQPFAAESALRQLPSERGAMRGWIPYFQLLTNALHAQGKHASELEAARVARTRFPDRIVSYAMEVTALAALNRQMEIERVLNEARQKADPMGTELGELLLVAAMEARAHGDSVSMRPFIDRAAAYFGRSAAENDTAVLWGRMRVASLRADWPEAARLGERLIALDSASALYQGALGVAYARLGNTALTQVLSSRLMRDERRFTFGTPQYEAARIAAALGRTADAARYIEAAFAKGYPFNLDAHRDPAFDGLRTHPLLAPVARTTR